MLPILFSFRRCPYAIRARIALYYSNIEYELREIDLKDKPHDFLAISPKATVPVLKLVNGRIIDESLDIISYALQVHNPERINLISDLSNTKINNIIQNNDKIFVKLLHQYKYCDRYPNHAQSFYLRQIEDQFLVKYEKMLQDTRSGFLFDTQTIADIALWPFIRQCALVDREWFFNSKYQNIISWLNKLIAQDYFKQIIMRKIPPHQ